MIFLGSGLLLRSLDPPAGFVGSAEDWFWPISRASATAITIITTIGAMRIVGTSLKCASSLIYRCPWQRSRQVLRQGVLQGMLRMPIFVARRKVIRKRHAVHALRDFAFPRSALDL
jgi:hypothetical protein